jgi:predicted transposase YdaD
MEEGRKEKALETAMNLLAMGLSPEQVAQGTGLDIDRIKELAK